MSLVPYRRDVAVPPPVSVQFARDIGGYLSGLTLYRQGKVDAWVSWFADALDAAASRSGEVLEVVADLREGWRRSTDQLRVDAAARRIVEVLPAHPALSAAGAAALLHISEQAARTGLAQLAALGIVTETTMTTGRPLGRPRRWFVADDLLVLLGR